MLLPWVVLPHSIAHPRSCRATMFDAPGQGEEGHAAKHPGSEQVGSRWGITPLLRGPSAAALGLRPLSPHVCLGSETAALVAT
jgi:hypothetical protein